MRQTFKGTLHGNRIEWSADGGPTIAANQPTPVEVTVIGVDPNVGERGKKMADALKMLAASGVFSSIENPVAWQREQRVDQTLPGRET